MAEIFSLPNVSVSDRIFSLIAERTCTLFFYFSRAPGYATDQRPELRSFMPDSEQGLYHTYLQHVIRLIKNLTSDQMGEIGAAHIILHNAIGTGPEPARLEIRQADTGLRNFMLVEELIQGHMLYVPVMFSVPALPQVTFAAAACHWMLASIMRQINHRAMIDTALLIRLAQQKEMIFDRTQRPLEDRYRPCASLICYVQMKRVRHPIHS